MIALLTFMTIPVHAKGWKQDFKVLWYEYTDGVYASNRWKMVLFRYFWRNEDGMGVR